MWFLPPGLLRPSHGMAVYQKPARGKVESGKTAGPHRFCHVLLVRSKSQVSPALKEGELLGVTLVCINHNTVYSTWKQRQQKGVSRIMAKGGATISCLVGLQDEGRPQDGREDG